MMEDDGVALQATNHPLHITDEMVEAGAKAFGANWKGHSGTPDMVKAIFEAMVYASPPEPEDLNEDSLEHASVAIEVTPEMIAAGASVLCAMDLSFADEPTYAERVYRAMETVKALASK